ncbi:MAG: GNAT family N-acetyltransferase [Aquaticitalea sp.]
MELTIRNATLKDAEQIAELSSELGYPSSKQATQNRLKTILKSPDQCMYVAVQEDIIVGWIHGFYALRVESEGFVEIGGLVVSQEFQKKGIGKRLVKQVCNWSTTKQCENIRDRCNTVRLESHKFYEKLGSKTSKDQRIFHKSL